MRPFRISDFGFRIRPAAICALVLALSPAAVPLAAVAQQPANVPRVGILRSGSAPDPFVEAFRQRLRELGYTEDRDIIYRWAEGREERLPDLVADVVRLKVDLIVASGPGPALAAKRATTTIPIVMPASTNPVKLGLVVSLARSGGNVTGLASLADASSETGTRTRDIDADAVSPNRNADEGSLRE